MLKDQSKFFDKLITDELSTYFNKKWDYTRTFEINQIIKSIDAPAIKKVIDIGCGCGFHDQLLAQRLSNLSELQGIDYSEESIKAANKLYPHPKVKRFKADFNEITDNTFDLVVSFQVIEHLEDSETLIQKAYSMLKPGGFLAVATPNYARIQNRMLSLRNRKPVYSDPMHFREFCLKELKDLGCNAGFTVHNVFGYGFTFILPKLNKNIVPYKLGTHLGAFFPNVSDVICVVFRKETCVG